MWFLKNRVPAGQSNRRVRRSRGVALTEYAFLGILITVACFTAMQLLGGQISRIVNDSCNSIATAIAGT